jgi:septal ring factor EnvC (AmiA/AmiB activator)
MTDIAVTLTHLLSDVILPNLKAVQSSQAEQIAANDRLEEQINDLQSQIKADFARLQAQLTACRAEIAALQALVKSVQSQGSVSFLSPSTTVN